MNLIALAEEIEKRYRQYLRTTFYFKDPALRVSFGEALDSGHLSKGPYLEATPVFKRGQTPRAFLHHLHGSQLDEGFLRAIQGNRPLYRHQELAIQGIHDGRNIIVATGTGSGKTEAFIYPILLQLYQEFQAGILGPGVRALILYPMNALANDQRERLGLIRRELGEANSPLQFTFGQYIGETPEDETDSHRHARDHLADRLPGELVLRSEMRKEPPHILLTNYSMLEYLLLRPDDSPLFDKGRARSWKFLVLDEAHQYRGSRGTEMAMLLRRLKRRLFEGGRTESFRCIATSATLVGGEGDKAGVAKFACRLFDEEFREADVILEETEPILDLSEESLSPDAYQVLAECLQTGNLKSRGQLAEMAGGLGLQLSGIENLPETVAALLQHDNRSTALRRLATKNPAEVQSIADGVFRDLPHEERIPALSELVELLLRAREPSSGAPLLSARYHLFLRSLEGAFVSYWPEKRVFLDRKAADGATVAFEVALCRECGQHYIVGPKNFKGGRLVEAIRDPSHPDFGATYFLPLENGAIADDEGENDAQQFHLCIQCGLMRRGQPECEHGQTIKVLKQNPPQDEDRADQMARCSACGYNAAGHDPVREVIHGTDGPHAVIATTLYRSLPETRKKVLAFADGRQEAAFFAWYLQDSYKDILSRNLVLKVALSFEKEYAEGLSLRTLASHALGKYAGAFKERESDDEPTILWNIWRALYREFLTPEERISLEGVGLIRWLVKWPDWFRIPGSLKDPPWSLTEQESWNVMAILMDSMRTDRAVELRAEKTVSLNWADLGIQPSQMCFRIGAPGRPKGYTSWPVKSWDGMRQHNHIVRTQRTMFLAKILINGGMKDGEAIKQAVETLREIWAAFQKYECPVPAEERLLLSVLKYDARRLNPDWWRLCHVPHNDTIFQCNTCGRIQAFSVHGVCLRHRCPGVLKEIRAGDLEPNHYRLLYEADLPGSLRVEEHTAQLDKEKAREFQREFRQGKIHVLSCSTTFELGVDLGDLDTIFLRNVPPESFNYAQRVGRAGRRSGYPGFAITYCRRGPHDLYHFSEPQRMLAGRVQAPFLSLQNEKISIRHVIATALSAFFHSFPERFKTVTSLFKDLAKPSGVADFKTFLQNQQSRIEDSLRAIVPMDLVGCIGLSDGSWVGKITSEDSQFALAEAEVSSDYQAVRKLETTSAATGDYDKAKWAKARAKTIAEEKVLSFLSRKAVIPKYGFPVDVVELDTQRTQQTKESMEVSLQRDLTIAIAEFAPTSKLVANKREWTSYGLKRVAGLEWERKLYKKCAKHNVFLRWKKESEIEPPTPCGDQLPSLEYVIPRFGFITDSDKPKEPTSRTARVFTTRPYFAGPLGPNPGSISLPSDSPLITVRKASPGWMAVLCEGRRGERFYICSTCGAGFRRRQIPHKGPYGEQCSGTLSQVSLGHEFVTDVLQVQFLPKPNGGVEFGWFGYSLAYALVEGAASSEVLEIPSADLNATVAFAGGSLPVPPIILYDNVPGGAGLVARLEGETLFRASLAAALDRVSGKCGCGDNTSCYGCLRSYRNQFAHQNLQRGPVMRYLSDLLQKWKPRQEVSVRA